MSSTPKRARSISPATKARAGPTAPCWQRRIGRRLRNAGGPYSGETGVRVPLTAAASIDPDQDDRLSYDWNFGDGSTGSGIAPSHAYASEGPYTVTVTVSDGRGGSNSAQASVLVSTATDRSPPSVSLSGPATTLPGVQVTMTAQAFDDRGVAAVVFEVNGGNPTETSAVPYQRVLTVPAVASPGDRIVVRATARDAANNQASTEATVTITAVPDTEPPTVEVHAPPKAAPGSQVRITATAQDNVGVQSVSLAVGGGAATTLPTPPYEITYSIPADAVPGSSIPVVAHATDYSGNQDDATVAVAVVQVSESDTTPPVVDLFAPLQVFAGKLLALTADAKDDVGVASVAFVVNGVTVATITEPPYAFNLPLGPGYTPGALLAIQAKAVDFANLEGADSAQTLIVAASAAGQGVLTGEVYDDTTSLPLPGATVALTGEDGTGSAYGQTTTTDSRGRWAIHATEGTGVIRVTKAGWTSVDRPATVGRRSGDRGVRRAIDTAASDGKRIGRARWKGFGRHQHADRRGGCASDRDAACPDVAHPAGTSGSAAPGLVSSGDGGRHAPRSDVRRCRHALATKRLQRRRRTTGRARDLG